ncbi:hypothetical protein ACIQZN_31195 [Streptomyces sp. NPDC097595]|uniref:hypothetical protein n=1 Tax=Streptomyces sp. NPDC097595 TaxID=3366090 RepID=UPI0037FC0A9B
MMQFATVFDGPLLLPDGRIAVGDVKQLTRLTAACDHSKRRCRTAITIYNWSMSTRAHQAG